MIYLLLKINGEFEGILQEEIESIVSAVDIENIVGMVKSERKVENVEVVSYKNIENPDDYRDKDVQYIVKYLDRQKDVVDYKDVLVPNGIVSFEKLIDVIGFISSEYQVSELYLLDWQIAEAFDRVDDES